MRRHAIAVVMVLVLLAPRVARADGRSYNTAGTLDWVTVEERRPYFSGGNWSPFLGNGYPVVSDEGASFDFYTGLGNGGSAGSGFWHWSTWPISNPINPTDTVKIAYLGTTTWGHDSDGAEGTSAGFDGLPAFGFNTGVWYRFAIRCWRPADGTPHLGYAGEWMRDGSTGVWYHCCTFQTPFAAKGVTGLGGFIEGLGPSGFRTIHFRNAFAHQYGQPSATIQRANQITINWNNGAGYGGLIENGTAAMAWSDGGTAGNDPVGERYANNVGSGLAVTMPNQPAAPPFDAIVVNNTSASVTGNQLLVKWELPATSSPQLTYKIEVFNNAGYTGSPSLTFLDREPETRQKLLDVSGIATPYVRLTISDIFDNAGTPVLLTPATATLSAATSVPGAVGGLNYKYYQAAAGVTWSAMPDFTGLTPTLQGAVDCPDTTPRQRRSEYAFNYTGYIQVPADGIYSFSLSSYDSGRFIVDGTTVVDFDGLHQWAEKSGAIALQAGMHPVSLQYAFSDQRGQTTLWDNVAVSYEGPGIAKSAPPASAWFRMPPGGEPSVTLSSPSDNSTVSGANVALTSSVTANGATVSKVQYYLGNYYLAQSAASPYAANVLYGAAAGNLLRARLFYNNGYTIDSSPQSLVATTNMNVSPWLLTPLEYHYYPSGAKVQGANVSMIGDSLNLMTRQVTGDCTFIARLAAITPNVAGPDGTTPDSSWRAGIIFRGNTALTIGEPLGNGSSTRSTELFGSVGGGSYYEDDTMRGGNGDANMWSGDVGGANRWFKIVRSGDTFVSSVSPDGANWTQVRVNTLAGIGTTICVGMFTHAPQSLNPNLFTATFDNISISGGVVGAPSVTVSPATARASAGQTVTFKAGVVGQPPFGYQWMRNGSNISGATGDTLTLANAQLSDAGTYNVSLVAGNGTATSDGVNLTVVPPLTWDATTTTTGAQDGTGTWNATGTNWWDGSTNVLWSDNNTAVFGVSTTLNRTVTLANDVTPLSLTFNAAGGGAYTLAGSYNIWSGSTPLPVVANGNATISAVLNGSGGIAKSGSGTLTFSGANSYASTGGVFVNGGILVLNTPGYNTFNGGGVYINNGSTFRVTRSGGSNRYDFGGKSFYFDANGGGTVESGSSLNFVFMGTNTFASAGGAQDFIIGAGGLNLNYNTAAFVPTRGTGASDIKVSTVMWNSGSVSMSGNGILELTAANTYSGTTTVNSGTLLVNSPGSIAAGGVTVQGGATLGGTGTIGGATTVAAGGTLSPGFNGIGTLTLNNALTLQGVVAAEINKTTSACDKVQGASTLTYGGVLTVTNLSGTLAAGDVFTLFAATTYAGGFSNINLPPLGAGLVWDTSNLTVNGSIQVLAFTGTGAPASGPSGATATAVSTTQINLSWNAVAGATSYVVSRNGVAIAVVTGTSYSDTGLNPGTAYGYVIAAVNAGGSAASAGFGSSTPITGAILTWDADTVTGGAQDGVGTWSSSASNWLYGGSDLPWGDGNAAVIGVNTATGYTITIPADVTPTGVSFSNSGAGSYTIAGGGGGIVLTGAPTFATNANATISAVLKGTGSMTKTGAGTLTLSAQNTYTGVTTVSAGTLNLPTAQGSGGTTLKSAVINLSPGTTLTCNNGAFGWYGNNNAGGLTININGATCQPNGAFGVAYGLTGGVLGTGSSRLDLGISGGFSSSITSYASATTSVINPPGGFLLRGDSGQSSYVFTSAAGSTASGIDLDVQKAINENSSACTVVKAGPGTLSLSATNTYTGATTINGGTLVLGAPGSSTYTYNGGGIAINNGSTLRISGGQYSFNAKTFTYDANGGGTIIAASQSAGGFTFLGAGNTFVTTGGAENFLTGTKGSTGGVGGNDNYGLNLNAKTATFNVAPGSSGTSDLTVSATIWGSGSIVKTGNGILTLTGANTYTGTTTSGAGTLYVNGSLASGSAVTVNSSGVLGGTGTVGGTVSLSGTLAPGCGGVGVLTIGGALTLAASSAISWEIGDWTGVAGVGFDKVSAASMNITATPANPVVLSISERFLANFAESNRSFVMLQTTSGITGFAANKFSVVTSGFVSGHGTWAVQQSGNNLLLAYTRANTAPVFATDPIAMGGTQGVAMTGFLSAVDPDIGETLAYAKLGGPAWLSIASNGALSGIPANADVGTNSFSVSVTDSFGASGFATLHITVANVNDAPTFTNGAITGTAGTQDLAYSGTLAGTATDPDSGYGDTMTFSKVSGPSWLVVGANGTLSGTPTNANVGNNTFTVKVTDTAGLFATATLNITVANVNDAPTFTNGTITGTAGTQGVAYSGTLAGAATDPDSGYGDTMTFSKVSGPSWLVVGANGTLSGTPGVGDTGTQTFTVRVTDGGGLHAEATLRVEIVAVNPDANGNGILDAWETTHFGNAGAGNNGANDDADGDGLCNLLEYALATDPVHPNANPITHDLEPVDGRSYLRISVPKNPAATNLDYIIEVTDDLAAGHWSVGGLVTEEDSEGRLTVRDNVAVDAGPRRFMRLRVTVKP